MTRMSPLAGPGGIVTVLALVWMTAAGVVLAWLACPSSSGTGLRAVVSRLLTGGMSD